jgi:hypothetical protein
VEQPGGRWHGEGRTGRRGGARRGGQAHGRAPPAAVRARSGPVLGRQGGGAGEQVEAAQRGNPVRTELAAADLTGYGGGEGGAAGNP